MRHLLKKLHLYIGLGFGAIFVLSGLTGSAIAWLHEIDRLLNPDLFQVAAAPGPGSGGPSASTPARVQAVVDRLSLDPQYGRPAQLMIPGNADEVFVAWYRSEPATKGSLLATETSRQVMVDPHTLRVKGERIWGEPGVSRRLLMPTIFHLHRYLLAGEFGKILIGVSGLVLLFTAISGLVLWWPKLNRKALRLAVSISYRGSWPRLAHSSHRAIGLFAAPVLAVLGFSGWYFNLPGWVVPIVSHVASVSPSEKLTNFPSSRVEPISPAQAVEAAQASYPDGRVSRIALPANPSMPYEIRVRQPSEVRQGDGATRLTIDAYTGKVLRARDPLRAPAGDVFLGWLFPLHSGEAFGMVGRIFIGCFGLVPLLFLVTGFSQWLVKR